MRLEPNNDLAKDSWRQGHVLALDEHQLDLPAHCLSEEIVKASLDRFFHDLDHDEIPVEVAINWRLPQANNAKFLAQKRADSENRRLLG